MATKKAKETGPMVEIQQLKTKRVSIKIKGLSPFISHNWSFKAKKEMLDKQMKKAKAKKEARDPWMDYCESFYWLTPKPYPDNKLPVEGDKGYPTPKDIKNATFGFPAVAIKNAMVTAVTSMGQMTKVAARQAFHVVGEYIQIEGKPEMVEDMVRLSGPGSSADLRYRPYFRDWKSVVTIDININVISVEQAVSLLNTAGFSVGIGDWRPEKNGVSGRFEVVA